MRRLDLPEVAVEALGADGVVGSRAPSGAPARATLAEAAPPSTLDVRCPLALRQLERVPSTPPEGGRPRSGARRRPRRPALADGLGAVRRLQRAVERVGERLDVVGPPPRRRSRRRGRRSRRASPELGASTARRRPTPRPVDAVDAAFARPVAVPAGARLGSLSSCATRPSRGQGLETTASSRAEALSLPERFAAESHASPLGARRLSARLAARAFRGTPSPRAGACR